MKSGERQINKDILLARLEHTKNNYILGLASCTLLYTDKSYPLLEGQIASFGPYTISFDQVTNLMNHPDDREIALKEYLKMHMRTLVKESFEHIKDYCDKTDQYSRFKGQSWYEFARLIRNFLSHNCVFEFTKYDRDKMPVVWRNKVITWDMDDTSPDFTFFGQVETWELFEDFERFVVEELD